jgi:hypothetical protein
MPGDDDHMDVDLDAGQNVDITVEPLERSGDSRWIDFDRLPRAEHQGFW